ncbi:Uridine kinase [Fimbriiglobus ruber]|uniref:uridine/cytidine kinase n=1 Tax=Fimbriiglobus ruber TaxID=1908690 RepID=A0A225DVS5_9BACT|nr:Uridine kinase [Fimbriiglobus ruber]
MTEGKYGTAISVLTHDSYYLDKDRLPIALVQEENWDHPHTLDNALFVEHIERLKRGQAVTRPVYDFKIHARLDVTEPVLSRPVLILDGVLLLAVPEIREQIDLRVYVDTPPDERLARRLLRDVAERGRTFASVVSQFRKAVRPMHNCFVEPSRSHAHIIVPWDSDGGNRVAVEVVVSHIGAVIAARNPQ